MDRDIVIETAKRHTGREKLFESYKITVCKSIREYSDTDRREAPADSNEAMGI